MFHSNRTDVRGLPWPKEQIPAPSNEEPSTIGHPQNKQKGEAFSPKNNLNQLLIDLTCIQIQVKWDITNRPYLLSHIIISGTLKLGKGYLVTSASTNHK